jgi:malonyl-ACP O-methyltransferase BioC
MKSTLFDKAADTYDSVADAQVSSSAYLAEMLNDFLSSSDAKTIIDIGCGTGNTSLELMRIYPNARYTLCDASKNMINKAKNKIGVAHYIVADAEKYDFTEQYSLGVSNLAVQWFESIDDFLGKILANCRYFAFSTLTEGSLKGLSGLTYLSVEEIKKICSNRGKLIKCATKRYDLQFENSFALARYFRKLGATIRPLKKTLSCDEKIILTYNVFFGIVCRE